MDDSVNTSAIAGLIIRHALTTAGGGLVAKGIISASMLEPTVGAVMTLGGLFLSYLQKRKAAKS
jgi:hypothetical protein